MLQTCNTTVHLSFDLWTSPNKYAFLGIVCHFIDYQWKARIVLLGLRLLYNSHAKVNIAQLVIHVIKCYRLAKLLGYCIIDNASDNNITLKEVSRYLFVIKGVI